MSVQPLSLGVDDDHNGKPWCMQYLEQAGLARGRCEACMPGGRGRNCWELDMSLCCEHPRTDCERCHVYLSYLRQTSRAVQVTIALDPGHQISGNIHVPADARISEAVNSIDRHFLPVTGLGDDPRLAGVDCMLVNTQAIRYLIPHPKPAGDGHHSLE